MSLRQPRYSKEEFARLGDEIYERDIRPLVETDNKGKVVAIDIETGAWEIDTDEITASARLEARYPDAQIWIVRVGFRYVRRFGAGESEDNMITGNVNADYEPIIRVAVCSFNTQVHALLTLLHE